MKDRAYNFFKYIGEYTLYGLLFFLAISNALVEIFAVMALIGFIGRKIIKPDFNFLKFRPNIFLLLFLFFSALSLFNSGVYLNKSINALFGKWMQYLGIYIIVQDSAGDQKVIKRGIFVFLFGASLAVLSGLTQYFLGFEFLRNRSIGVIEGFSPISSSFNHYNSFAGYLVVVLPLVVVLLLANNSFSLKTISLIVFSIFTSAAVMLTFSRGSWLALVFSFIFTVGFAKKNLKWLIPILLLISGMFLLSPFHERLFFTFKAGGDKSRLEYWMASFRMINDHPFLGMGVGTYMANFSKYLQNSCPSYAHNCYLQIWAETGIFSLISFVAFIVSIFFFSIKSFLARKDFLLLGLLSGVTAFLVHSFFDTNFYSLRLVILFWIWVALIVARGELVYNK